MTHFVIVNFSLSHFTLFCTWCMNLITYTVTIYVTGHWFYLWWEHFKIATCHIFVQAHSHVDMSLMNRQLQIVLVCQSWKYPENCWVPNQIIGPGNYNVCVLHKKLKPSQLSISLAFSNLITLYSLYSSSSSNSIQNRC